MRRSLLLWSKISTIVITPSIDFKISSHIETGLPRDPGRQEQCLTYPERRRYIRAYYQLWGLLILEREQHEERLNSILLKDLIIMEDIAAGSFQVPRQYKIGDDSISKRALSDMRTDLKFDW